MSRSPEFDAKRSCLAAWLAERDSDAVLLASPPNLYWLALGGEVRQPTSISSGFAVTADRCWLLCPADDAERLRQEEVRGLGLEIVPLEWQEPDALVQCARELLPEDTRWRCDLPGLGLEYDASVHALRQTLLPEEVERLRRLGHDAAGALEEVAAECFRGILERDAAARLAAECIRRQIAPVSILSGADERVASYPRPLPKSGAAEHVLLLSLVGMRGGLHVALSRIICLASPRQEFLERFAQTLEASARLSHETRAGEVLGAVMERVLPSLLEGTRSLGGLVGYRFPEVEARPGSDLRLAASQAMTWSLSGRGVRCEDTFLINDTSNELLTLTDGWPRRRVQIDGRSCELPDLLLL
ncbi:MAG: M24 family metallopeptidase [Candidatus Krumholzibacteriia bacterium]